MTGVAFDDVEIHALGRTTRGVADVNGHNRAVETELVTCVGGPFDGDTCELPVGQAELVLTDGDGVQYRYEVQDATVARTEPGRTVAAAYRGRA